MHQEPTLCTFFGETICLLTNRKIIKIVTLIDWLTYCIDIWLSTHCFLLFNIWVSHALKMTLNFYYHATLQLFRFSFNLSFIYSKCVYPTLFSSVPPPAINNNRSLRCMVPIRRPSYTLVSCKNEMQVCGLQT
jgi:hypothetical protein